MAGRKTCSVPSKETPPYLLQRLLGHTPCRSPQSVVLRQRKAKLWEVRTKCSVNRDLSSCPGNQDTGKSHFWFTGNSQKEEEAELSQ